jgi:hypothetical protein
MKTISVFCLLLFSALHIMSQEVHEIIYRLDCPFDWQDSVMATMAEPSMILYCSAGHSLVKTNSPFGECMDSRIMDLPQWMQKTAKGYWVQYQGEEADSALVSFSILTEGKAKKSDPIMGFSTKRLNGRSPAFTREKIDITYTEDLRGVHPWCLDLQGIPLRIVIPTEIGSYTLEAKEIKKRILADIPTAPRATIKAENGQEVKEHFFSDPDSTSLIVFGLVTDEFSENALGLVEVKVFEKDQLLSTTRTDLRGVYDLRLKAGGLYQIEIGTAPYVVKRIQIELLTMRPKGDNPMLQLDGSIFKNPKQIDCGLLKSPILKLHYDMNAKEIVSDVSYNDGRQEQLRLLLEQIK